MKNLILIYIPLLFYVLQTAVKTLDDDPAVCTTPKDCSLDLRNALNNSIAYTQSIIYGKNNSYMKDVSYPPQNAPTCGISNTSIVCENNVSVLQYIVYYPKFSRTIYNSCPLPAVLIFHGGSYSDCSDLHSPQLTAICNEFAKRGFVVFDVDYRKGCLSDTSTTVLSYVAAQQILAIYRASQDARGAIRSIIKRARNESTGDKWNDPYRIDTNNIFMAGISAGSLVAINATYYQSQGKIDSAFPGVHARLGSININYYYGDTTIEYYSKIRGVFNMWGAMLIPASAAKNPINFFRGNVYNPNMISFCGYRDSTFLFENSFVYFSPPSGHGYNFNSETNCLDSGGTFKLLPLITSPDLYQLSADGIYDMFQKSHPVIYSELYIDTSMSHGLDKDGKDFKSNFGTGLINSYQVDTFMVHRAATFFQATMNNNLMKLDKRIFIECPNNRHGCDTFDDPICKNASLPI